MLGFKLFAHALRMVLIHWRVLIGILILPALVGLVAKTFLALISDVPFLALIGGPSRDLNYSTSAWSDIVFIANFLLSALLWAWIAVRWHRYVLLGETTAGPFSRPDMSYTWRYLLWVFAIGFGALVPVMILVISLLAVLDPRQPLFLLVQPIYIFAIWVITLRLGILLPAIALGNRMSFREAWAAGKGSMAAIFVIALLEAGLYFVVISISASIVGFQIWPSLAFNLLTTPALFVLGISLLTTLYGYFVENRPLT